MPGVQPFPVIIGPTAGGKSGLAVDVALRLAATPGFGPGEVVTADAFQVYRGMDIGTAKPPPAERRGVPHHLIDIRDPAEPFTVDDWLSLAEGVVGDVCSRAGTPVVAGGTHLYIKALLDGLFEGPAPDPALRQALQALSPADRRVELERVDPASAARIHPNDARRTVRALEVFRATGRPISEHQKQWDRGASRPDALLVALIWPTELINRRINARVAHMIETGLVEEARGLWEAGRLGQQAREGLGYKQLIRHFEGVWTLGEAVEQIKIETRRLGKSQRTWIRRLAGVARPVRDMSEIGSGASGEGGGGAVLLDAGVLSPDKWPQVVVESLVRRAGGGPAG